MEAARDAAVAEYPAMDPPPMDADGFVVSFPPPRVSFSSSSSTTTTTAREDDTAAREDDAAALAFFRRYGFVVYRDVLTREECAATRAEIWDFRTRPVPSGARRVQSPLQARRHHVGPDGQQRHVRARPGAVGVHQAVRAQPTEPESHRVPGEGFNTRRRQCLRTSRR